MTEFLAPVAPFLALVLLAAALHKFVARERVASAAARLCGTSKRRGRILSVAAAAIEATSAVAMLGPSTRVGGALAATALWALYAILLGAKAARRTAPFDCGCDFGSAGRASRGSAVIIRPLGLMGLAGFVILAPSTGALTVEPLFASLGYFAIYVATGEIVALPPLRRNLAA